MRPGCEVVCFSLTVCLLRKMSAVHLQHIHFEITFKTQHGNKVFLQEPVEKQAAQQDVLYTLLYKYKPCLLVQCQGFTVRQTEVLSTECAVFGQGLICRASNES